jgi:hypothetical protein
MGRLPQRSHRAKIADREPQGEVSTEKTITEVRKDRPIPERKHGREDYHRGHRGHRGQPPRRVSTEKTITKSKHGRGQPPRSQSATSERKLDKAEYHRGHREQPPRAEKIDPPPRANMVEKTITEVTPSKNSR